MITLRARLEINSLQLVVTFLEERNTIILIGLLRKTKTPLLLLLRTIRTKRYNWNFFAVLYYRIVYYVVLRVVTKNRGATTPQHHHITRLLRGLDYLMN